MVDGSIFRHPVPGGTPLSPLAECSGSSGRNSLDHIFFESHKPFEVCAVRSSYMFLTFVTQKVDIDTGAGKPSCCCPERTSPLDMILRLFVGPRCEDAQDVRFMTLGKGNLGRMNATCGTMEIMNQVMCP